MTRRRYLKPFVYDARIQTLDHVAFRLYMALVSEIADPHGRLIADPEMVAGAAFWGLHGTAEKVSAPHVKAALERLAERGLVTLYHAHGRDYAEVCEWETDQVVRRPGRSKFPGPKEATPMALVSAEMGKLKADMMDAFSAVWAQYHRGVPYLPSSADYIELGKMLAVLKAREPESIERLPEWFLAYVKDRDEPYYARRRHPLALFCSQAAWNKYRTTRGVVEVVPKAARPAAVPTPIKAVTPPPTEAWFPEGYRRGHIP